jgi:hypothetical protein
METLKKQRSVHRRSMHNNHTTTTPFGSYRVEIQVQQAVATKPLKWKKLPHTCGTFDLAEQSVGRFQHAYVPARMRDFLEQVVELPLSHLAVQLIREWDDLFTRDPSLNLVAWEPKKIFGPLQHHDQVALLELVSVEAFVMDGNGYLLAQPEQIRRLHVALCKQGGLLNGSAVCC